MNSLFDVISIACPTLIFFTIPFLFGAFVRYLRYRETLALAERGLLRESRADNSRSTHLEAELIDVGAGVSERDYEGRDVKGKVVLASGPAARVQQEAVWKRGAAGVLSWQTNRPDPMDAPDQVAW